ITSDRQLFKSDSEIKAGEIVLEEIPAGTTGQEYFKRRPDYQFCDAHILAALVDTIVKASDKKALRAFFGDQEQLIYFFGTNFQTERGECIAFLNLSSELPAI